MSMSQSGASPCGIVSLVASVLSTFRPAFERQRSWQEATDHIRHSSPHRIKTITIWQFELPGSWLGWQAKTSALNSWSFPQAPSNVPVSNSISIDRFEIAMHCHASRSYWIADRERDQRLGIGESWCGCLKGPALVSGWRRWRPAWTFGRRMRDVCESEGAYINNRERDRRSGIGDSLFGTTLPWGLLFERHRLGLW